MLGSAILVLGVRGQDMLGGGNSHGVGKLCGEFFSRCVDIGMFSTNA
jgi:hypothetical protein